MSSYPQNPAQPLKSLLYWRRSKVNGAGSVPVVMTLDAAGVLSMQGQDLVTMFAVPATEVAVRFSSRGALVLTVHGRRYEVAGAAASMSEEPSPAQVAAVGGRSAGEAASNRAGSAVVGRFANVLGLEAIKAWRAALSLAGARVTKSALAYYALAVGAAVVIGLLVLLVSR